MSIFHRITGVVLSLGLPIFFIWLTSLVDGAESYSIFVSYCHTPLGQTVLFGLAWSFFYHFFCGLRHLLWDAGYFLSIKGLYTSGYIALGLSILLTATLALKIYGVAL